MPSSSSTPSEKERPRRESSRTTWRAEKKTERIVRLVDLQKRITGEINRTYVGKTVEVLVEEEPEKHPGSLSGRTDTFKNTIFPKENFEIGDLVLVEIERSRGSALFGRAVGRRADAERSETGRTKGTRDMADSMWALVFDRSKDTWEKSRGLRKVRVEKPVLDEAKDPLDAERVIIQVLYTGFCGSDKTTWYRDVFKEMIYDSLDEEKKDCRIAGHELLGRVVKVGSLAERHYGFAPGDVVTAESHITCGKCLQCRLGQREVCQDTIIIGFSLDGCFAEYIKLPAEILWRTDTRKIRPEVAAIQEPFGNAVHACTKVDLRGKSLAVFGCGTIGMLSILTARALGVSRIIGIEPIEENARLAEKLGVTRSCVSRPKKDRKSDPGVVEKVTKFGGDGVDVAFEMAGYNSSVNNALRSVRMGGDVVLFGIKSGDFNVEEFSDIVNRGISLHGVIGRRLFQTWSMLTNLLEAKENRIQEQIYDVILNGGKDTIVRIDDYDVGGFRKTHQRASESPDQVGRRMTHRTRREVSR